MTRRTLLILSSLCFACGPQLQGQPDPMGAGEVSVSNYATSDAGQMQGAPGPDAGQLPSAAQPLPAAVPDAGNPASNIAKELWNAKELAESAAEELRSKYGQAVIGLVRIASNTAGYNSIITYGTVTETAPATYSWSSTPTDSLVIKRKNGDTYSVKVSLIVGDIRSQYFPTGSDRIEFTWEWTWAHLGASYAHDRQRWTGWYFNDAVTLLTVDLVRTWDVDAVVNPNSSSVVASSTIKGTVRWAEFAVTLDNTTDRFTCGGAYCSHWFFDTEFKVVIQRRLPVPDGVIWSIDGSDDTTYPPSGATANSIDFRGIVAKNGVAVGSLKTRAAAQYVLVPFVTVGQQVYELPARALVP